MNPYVNLPADAFLAAQPRSKEAPFFIESTFAYKLRRDRSRTFKRGPELGDPVERQLLRDEWEDVRSRADLSAREALVVQARLSGETFEEIGHRLAITRQAAHLVWQGAVTKLQRARASSPYTGLRDVYLSEIRRGKRTQMSRHPSD